jgi:hypothetical protein
MGTDVRAGGLDVSCYSTSAGKMFQSLFLLSRTYSQQWAHGLIDMDKRYMGDVKPTGLAAEEDAVASRWRVRNAETDRDRPPGHRKQHARTRSCCSPMQGLKKNLSLNRVRIGTWTWMWGSEGRCCRSWSAHAVSRSSQMVDDECFWFARCRSVGRTD